MTSRRNTARKRAFRDQQRRTEQRRRDQPAFADPTCPNRLHHHAGTVCAVCGGQG